MKAISRLIAAVLCLSVPVAALGAERRLAVVVGNDMGQPNEPRLRFARRDATRFAQTFRELGQVASQDLILLLDEEADTVRQALAQVELKIAASPEPVMLLFYYSGHADNTALHLGGTTLTWHELKETFVNSKAALRLALVDACQAGAMIQGKGMSWAEPVDVEAGAPRGMALLVAAAVNEQAQESLDLGGSFFTHHLVSGLRGAADGNQDGRVTLAEAYAYASGMTRQTTSSWARTVQHPVFELDIAGHGEVTLTDLREAAAELVLAPELAGHLTITEIGSPLIEVETDKLEGRSLTLALPAGRYRVYLRDSRAVHLADVVLPWGGSAAISDDMLTPMSLQTVAQKGAILELHRHSLALGGAFQTAVVSGMGISAVGRVTYVYRPAPLELGLQISGLRKDFNSVDTTVSTMMLGVGVSLGYGVPLGIVDLRAAMRIEGVLVQQRVRKAGERRSGMLGIGAEAAARLPVSASLFVEAWAAEMTYVGHAVSGSALHPTFLAGIDAGATF